MAQLTETECALCSQSISTPFIEGENQFCCRGCQAVFNILAARNELEDFSNNPLYLQAVRSGLISAPHLLNHPSAKQPFESEKLYLEINEMWCPSCAEFITLVLNQEEGVKHCLVDYATDLAVVEFFPRCTSREKIFEKISSLGYRPSFLAEGETEQKTVQASLYFRFFVAVFFSLNIMMFSYPLYATYFDFDGEGVGKLFAWISCAASIPVLCYSGYPILKRAWSSLTIGLPGMELLVSMGVLSSFGLSVFDLLKGGTKVYFDSMTVIITFVLLGKIIEAKAKFLAKSTLFRLNRALPRKGRKLISGQQFDFVPIKEIHPGDTLMALTGERIILDGIVLEGEGSCEESMMTGEAAPVNKKIGSALLGGTYVSHGWFKYSVTNGVEQSALQRIIQLIEREIGSKSRYVRITDPLSRWFVPFILMIACASAFGAFLFESDPEASFIRFVSILLISCPCAIGIAAPLAEAHLMKGLAKQGAVLRNRGCLQYLGKETCFVFDKTGTITEGHFQVLNWHEQANSWELSVLKSMSARSSHPVSRAIFNFIESEQLVLEKIEEFSGKGMGACFEGQNYFFGSASFLMSQGIQSEFFQEEIGNTKVFFANSQAVIAWFELGDKVKEQAAAVVSLLPESLLLSGDGKGAVEKIAGLCGFSGCKWGQTPQEKKKVIDELKGQGKIVCMVGDGINDAPALTAAHVGISVVSATDISIQVSDILLTTDRLDAIPKIGRLAKKGRKIIHQNLFWAFFYNMIGVGFAVCGSLSPVFASFAMVASSLIVLFNSQRIGKITNPESLSPTFPKSSPQILYQIDPPGNDG